MVENIWTLLDGNLYTKLWNLRENFIRICDFCGTGDEENGWHISNGYVKVYGYKTMCNTCLNKCLNDTDRKNCPLNIYGYANSVSERKTPESLVEFVTKERIDWWSDVVLNIVYIPENFGSVRGWAPISDPYEEEECETFLLAECAENAENISRIASAVIDYDGRIGINIIYFDLADFWNAFISWQKENPKKNNTSIALQKFNKWLCGEKNLLKDFE
jgi:hypothetical protein